MGTALQQILRSLCLNAEWTYAVFWKLKHPARMVLTWEDAFYQNRKQYDPLTSSHDPLGFAVTKMSYNAYSLGEGIVGQVAVSGKHRWIFADDYVGDSSSSLEYYDGFQYCHGWQTQFSAGIKTIILVAVVPLGVVQLGSLKKVTEDLKLVNHIKDVFFALQGTSVGQTLNYAQHNVKTSVILPAVSKTPPSMEVLRNSPHNMESTRDGGRPHLQSASCVATLPEKYFNRAIDWANSFGESILQSFPFDLLEPPLDSKVEFDALNCYPDRFLYAQKPSSAPIRSETVENLNIQSNSSSAAAPNESYRFFAGCELHEALGSTFQKRTICYDHDGSNTMEKVEVAEGRASSSQLTSETDSDHLLEAVVAKVCHSGNDGKSEKSFCKSVQSLLTTGSTPELCSFNKRSPANSIDQLSTERSARRLLSNCPSMCSEQLDKSSEPAKGNRKRARPGESSRPRPRDRQLIQDRIKELRDLVPNGSKCSIDSLLERTIKHLLFLQSIKDHADKVKKDELEMLNMETTQMSRSSGREQGSSWAVEVGSHLKVCTIVVESLNMSGQMLVEMLCEECSHFLEIAEAIRSLGLTILKGMTEARGEKIWICFVVEGQKNRSLHRMDILWSLVQILQSKTTV